ncbi:MAG TPA: hypothetical protein VFP10_06710 [Candidatus Eisenbacteria bacterium]|nr:hypothetical protein [Candidatus Eisenbacteria bacterium]
MRSIVNVSLLVGLVGFFAQTTAQAADVRIDIRPGTSRNIVNPNSNGVIPVALLGSEDFSVQSVVVSGLQLSAQGSSTSSGPSGRGRIADVNGDGYKDLVMNFPIRGTGVRIGDTQLCLYGSGLTACDNIETVPPQ